MSQDRILTTHVGSLIRPTELTDLLLKRQNGEEVDEAVFEETLRIAVADVVRKQVDLGIDIISDGEYGKNQSWARYIIERLGGFEERFGEGVVGAVSGTSGKDRRDFPEFYAEYEAEKGLVGMGKSFAKSGQWVVTGPIKYTGQDQIQRDIKDFKQALEGVDVVGAFLPVVAPASVSPERKDEFYSDPDEALMAIAGALHEEYKAIIDSGLIVQIDDAYMATMFDVLVPPKSLGDYRKWAQGMIDATNEAIKGLPTDRIRYHLCWGSWNGPHTNDVPARDIMDLVLQLNVGQISLEMANPRHEHEWRIWEDIKLPEDKILLPGLVSHSTNVVEHPELVAERIVRVAKLVGRENVIASTDCGFAQGPFARRVHESIQWAKLSSVVEGAKLATRALWK